MATFHRFEELEIWQIASKLSLQVFHTTDLIKEYEELASKISGFIKYLNQSEIKGQKFKGR